MNFNIKFKNFKGIVQNLICDAKYLINKSETLRCLLSDVKNIYDIDRPIIDLDLTFMKYPIKKRHLKFLFQIMFNDDWCEKYDSDYDYYTNNLLLHNVKIYHLYTLLQLNDYFVIDDFENIISISKYVQAFISYLNDQNNDFISGRVNILSIKEKKILLLEELNNNFVEIFFSFSLLNKINDFVRIMGLVYADEYYPKFKLINLIPWIKIIPLTHLYICRENIKNKLAINEFVDLYDYYDLMFYETHKFHCYKPINSLKFKNDNMIVDYETFKLRFNEHTNSIFDDFDWSNVIMCGGFLYAILDKTKNSFLQSTDIDLFVYGDNVIKKIKYILEYFQSNNKEIYYIVNQNVITIIHPQVKYVIQIIPQESKLPQDIIFDFDLSYVKMYFDGKNIITNIEGLVSMKYNLAIYTSEYTKKYQFENL